MSKPDRLAYLPAYIFIHPIANGENVKVVQERKKPFHLRGGLYAGESESQADAQQRIVEMVLPEERLRSYISLQRRQSNELLEED